MNFWRKIKRKARHAKVILTSRPLIRDRGLLFPRIIWRTKVRGKTLIHKNADGKRETNTRRTLATELPLEGEHVKIIAGKRYPLAKSGRRWETYYEGPSLKDILDGNINRRVRKLLRENRLTFETLFDKCLLANEEATTLMSQSATILGKTLDDGPDQIQVKIENGKINFIFVDY